MPRDRSSLADLFFMGTAWRIEDDAGRVVPLKTPSGNDIPGEAVDAISGVFTPGSFTPARLLRFAIGFLVLIACAVSGALLAKYLRGVGVHPWVAMTPQIIGISIGVLVGSFFVDYRDKAAYARVFLDVNRCPSCGYDLTGTPADAVGLRPCPECGAAWRLEETSDAERDEQPEQE